MAKNTSEIPYTELVERCRKLARVGNNTVEKIRGVVQDIVTREIPSKFDWNFLLVSSSFTTLAQYSQGSVTINTGDTAAIFQSPASFDSTFSSRQIKFSANDQVYTITAYNNATSLTISPAFQGVSNVANGSYVIFQSVYPISRDFDRFPKNGGVYQWIGGKKRTLEEQPYRLYNDYTTFSPVSNSDKMRLVEVDTAGNTRVEIIPPPSISVNYGYDYFRQPYPMTETTAGTVSAVNAKGTTVTGNTNTRFLEAYMNDSSNLWFRVDLFGTGADSEWYRILSIQHDSSLTLATAFANTSLAGSLNYTISSSPDMPSRLHMAAIYGTLRSLELDQNDQNYIFYHTQYAQALSDSKRIYMSRPYAVEVQGIQQEYTYRY